MSKKALTVRRIHDALTKVDNKANVAGYIILDAKGEHVGTVRMSFPRDGAGRLVILAANWSAERPRNQNDPTLADFTNWTPWQYGSANGCGYDKATAAMGGMTIGTCILADSGHRWSDQLHTAGYRVIQAI